MNNTLLYVYRDLSDEELEEFATFAESTEGKAYYQAALAAIRAGLAVGQSTSNLTSDFATQARFASRLAPTGS